MLPLLKPLARLAAATFEHANIRKAGLAEKDKQDLQRRLVELEDSDVEQAELLGQLGEHLEELARGVEAHIRRTRRQEVLIKILLGVSTVLAAISIGLCVIVLQK
jgi:hypothetical protein